MSEESIGSDPGKVGMTAYEFYLRREDATHLEAYIIVGGLKRRVDLLVIRKDGVEVAVKEQELGALAKQVHRLFQGAIEAVATGQAEAGTPVGSVKATLQESKIAKLEYQGTHKQQKEYFKNNQDQMRAVMSEVLEWVSHQSTLSHGSTSTHFSSIASASPQLKAPKKAEGAGHRAVADTRNSCYIHATLQLLHAVPEYFDLIVGRQSPSKKKQEVKSADIDFCQRLRGKLQAIFKEIGSHSTASSRLIEELRSLIFENSYAAFDPADKYEQQDAGELLLWILEKLMELAQFEQEQSSLELFSTYTQRVSLKNDSALLLSEKEVKNLYLPLNFPAVEGDEALSIKELVEGRSVIDSYRIEQPSQEGSGIQTIDLRGEAEQYLVPTNAPPILTFQLNRFSYPLDRVAEHSEQVEEEYTKRFDRVRIDDELPWDYLLDGKKLQANYQLYCVIVHKGESAGSGHYLTFRRNGDRGWSCYDNDRVIPMDDGFNPSVALGGAGKGRGGALGEAYLVSYRRADDPNP